MIHTFGVVANRIREEALPADQAEYQWGFTDPARATDGVLCATVIPQRVIPQRLTFKGKGELLQFLDQRTAFPAMEWDHLFQNMKPVTDKLHPFLENVHRRSITISQTKARELRLHNKKGNIWG